MLRPHRAVAPAAMAILAILIAGCGSSGQSTGGSSTQAKVPNAVKSLVEKYRAEPKFTAPGPPIDARKAAGHTIFNIPVSSANAFLAVVDSGAHKAAALAGVKWIQYQNQGSPTDWIAGMNQAITQRADLIILNSQNPQQLKPQLTAADKAGVDVISEHLYDKAYPLPAGIDAFSFAPFNLAAKLEAAWTIADSGGDADVLIVTSDDFPPSRPQRDVMLNEFKSQCPHCQTRVSNVPSVQWSTKIQPTVQAALTKDPNLNYVIVLYDSMAPFAGTAIQLANRVGQTKIVTFNGTPAVLKMIEDGDIVAMDVGEDPQAIGYAAADQAFRLLQGLPAAKNEVTGLRIFDKTNVRKTGSPPEQGKGYGSDYEQNYLRLWGLAK